MWRQVVCMPQAQVYWRSHRLSEAERGDLCESNHLEDCTQAHQVKGGSHAPRECSTSPLQRGCTGFDQVGQVWSYRAAAITSQSQEDRMLGMLYAARGEHAAGYGSYTGYTTAGFRIRKHLKLVPAMQVKETPFATQLWVTKRQQRHVRCSKCGVGYMKESRIRQTYWCP